MLRAGLRYRLGLLPLIALALALALAFAFSGADAFRPLGLRRRQQHQQQQQRPQCRDAGELRMAAGKQQEDLACDFCLAVLGG